MQRQMSGAVRAVFWGTLALVPGCHRKPEPPKTKSAYTQQNTLTALNDAGQTVGTTRTTVDMLPAFVQTQNISRPLAVPSSTSWVVPHALNARGQIVGFAERGSDHTRHADFWNGTLSGLLNDNEARSSEAIAINGRGDIIGYSQDAGGAHHVLLWHIQASAAPPEEITPLSQNRCYPTGINERGAIVGWHLDAQNLPRLFLWQDQKLVDLGSGYHIAINNQGYMAGDCRMPGGEVNACIWKQGRSVPLPIPFDAEQSSALAINAHNQIVGRATPRNSGGTPRAMLWEQGRALDLNTVCPPNSPYTLEEATAINNAGQILCTGREGIWERSILLTPDGSHWRIHSY